MGRALGSAEIQIEKYRKVDVLPKYGIQGLTFQAKAPASSLTLRDNKTPNTNLYKQRRRSNDWVNSNFHHLFTKTFKQGSNMGIVNYLKNSEQCTHRKPYITIHDIFESIIVNLQLKPDYLSLHNNGFCLELGTNSYIIISYLHFTPPTYFSL